MGILRKIFSNVKLVNSFLATLILVLVFLFLQQDINIEDKYPKNTIYIGTSESSGEALGSVTWSLGEKISEYDKELEEIELAVGSEDITYYENRITLNGRVPVVNEVRRTDPEREIALKLLNTQTGDTEIIKIVKHGGELISPPGYSIEIRERVNGVRWNAWNTHYAVLEPASTIVIKNKYPIIKRERGGRVIEEFMYTPYSEELHTPEMVEAGRTYIQDSVVSAFNTLHARGAQSQSTPNTLVADTKILSPDFFERLPLLEQSDFTEFLYDPSRIAERVLVLIGLNRENAFAQTGSIAGAFGWIQFTEGTYHYIRRLYPEAQLIEDFETGAADHLNSMMAAILLHDNNLEGLMDRHGDAIVSDPRLEEYLAASYNGSPLTASKSLTASILGRLDDWINRLRPETKGFLAKLRYLQENELP